MELNKDRLKARIAEAWAEAKKGRAAVFNCCYQEQWVDDMLLKHADLFDYLGNQLWRHAEEYERLEKENTQLKLSLDAAKKDLSRKEDEVKELRALCDQNNKDQEKEKQS